MPINKIIPSQSRISAIESYVKNPNKTTQDNYFSNLCDEENVAKSFQQWNSCFNSRANKRTYYHIIVSYNPNDHITAEQCKEMTTELCERTKLSDYPYFGTIHTDTNHIHSHIIVNNCSIYGKSYQSTRASTKELQNISNEICLRYGFEHSIINIESPAAERLTTAEAQIILKKKELPWKEQLRYQIKEALSFSSSLNDFVENMKAQFNVIVSANSKGEFKFLTDHAEKPCPARRLGNNYCRESIEKQLSEINVPERGVHR